MFAPWPTLGHYRGDNLTNPMLIAAFDSRFNPKVTGGLATRMGPKARSNAYWGLNRDPSDSQHKALTY